MEEVVGSNPTRSTKSHSLCSRGKLLVLQFPRDTWHFQYYDLRTNATVKVRLVSELLRIFQDKQNRDAKPYWGCGSEPTCFEIGEAIRLDKLTPWNGNHSGTSVQGNREWHIGRIAWLALNWDGDHPVKVKSDDTDIDGGHRVYAAHYKGVREIKTAALE
jgi:hypothetical protein